MGRETRYEYDNFGRRIFRKLPGGETETKAYDIYSLSQVLNNSSKLVHHEFRTDFKSQTTKRIYDVRDRLVSKGLNGSGTPILFTYTPWAPGKA